MDEREELERLKAERDQMEKRIRELEQRVREASLQAGELPEAITTDEQLHRVLGRQIKKVAMILQAEKCLFMLHDRDTGELVAHWPALGFTVEDLDHFRIRATHGISGEVFREGKPTIVRDAINDPRADREPMALLNIKNAASVPLVLEERDEEQRVVSRKPIGVLHVFNKRMGRDFSDEDIRLLTILSRQVSAVIRNADIYIGMRQQLDRVQATLESLLAGVMLIDMKGQILLLNEAARRIFGIGTQGVEGKPFQELLRDEKTVDLLSRSLGGEKEIVEELTLRTPAERIFQAQVAPVHSEQGQVHGIVAIFNDITEIRNVDRLKSSFIARVSHELLTPLTSIKGFVSTLLEDKEGFFDQGTREEFYTIINEECDRLRHLIHDLLNLSRIEQGLAPQLHPRPTQVGDLARRVAEYQKMQDAFTEQHRLVVDVHPQVPEIMADEDRVEQIIGSLIDNAIKYSPGGGTITVKVVPDGEGVKVGVIDEGIGIPPELHEKVFGKFEKGQQGADDAQGTGAGIGLFMVKHLVEAHGGKIWIERSTPEQGSVFVFTLPKMPPPESVQAAF